MKIFDLTTDLQIWTTIEESKILKKLKHPVKLKTLNEHDQFIIEYMIRKDLVIKTGFTDPIVIANETKINNY